ncbi:MAG: hypothetical protein ACYCTY_15490 [Sulfuricella sp.]
MATKTTSTTDNNAGCSPCTPEAHQRAVFHNQAGGKEEKLVTCEGCIHLDKPEVGTGVAWCNFHSQYRSISTPRICEGVQFFHDND